MGTVVELKPSTIAKLALEPGDIVVVRSSENLSQFSAQRIHEFVKEAVGDHRVIVLPPNLSIEVLEKR